MTHIPLLRSGQPYRSLSEVELLHFQTGEPVAKVSQANPGLVARDLAGAEQWRRALEKVPVAELVEICRRAAPLFMEAELPLGEESQTPEQYVRQLSSTTGMPYTLCRQNMEKIRGILENMEEVLSGLTRGLPLQALEAGWSRQGGQTVSFVRQTDVLGAVLPNNSPGVHTLWLPAVPLRTPLVLKPGREEPWTPYRIAQALMAAGCPAEAFGYYPTDYAGAGEILLRSGRSMLFGDQSTIAPWKGDSRVQIHGPGWSKILFGEDRVERWEEYLEVLVSSVAANGGRSCINASGVWVPSRGREIAEALAQRLAALRPRPMEDPQAGLAAFPNPRVARRLSQIIDNQLKIPGAEEVTARFRGPERVVEQDGCTFLLPTVIWCQDPDHPLTNTEFLFPFAAVVEVPSREYLNRIGPTLVVTALTEDAKLVEELASSPLVDRLNVGPIPTHQVAWNQPHEGNLFEHLFKQRAFQMAAAR